MTPKEIENDRKTIVNVNQTRGDIIGTDRCSVLISIDLNQHLIIHICSVYVICLNTIVNIPNPKATREPTRTFTFDLVFGPESTQAEIYNETARPIVDAVLEGYNGE